MKKLLLTLGFAVMILAPTTGSAAIWYRPYWGGYWGPYYGYGYAYGGEIKLDTKVKDAEVFLNGGYVGTTHHAKTLHLRPGPYTVEIREAGVSKFNQKVYVVAGKTLHLRPML